MRLQKFLAQAGVGSRRHCEEMIRQGLVRVNGRTVTEQGVRVQPGRDEVMCGDRLVRAPDRAGRRTTIALHKPRGYICTRARAAGRTVYDLLPPEHEALVPVGRLDKDSEGLLLLSNDGDLVLRLTHPRFEHPKTYEVSVSGDVSPATLQQLGGRMSIDGYRIRPACVRLAHPGAHPGRVVLEFVLREGRNRQVRKMCEQAGLRVHRLLRRSIGTLSLAGLRPGAWRALGERELRELARPVPAVRPP